MHIFPIILAILPFWGPEGYILVNAYPKNWMAGL
jgi:hypothetical protein